eukprot:4894853-Amphidinium_carterae.1
MLLHVFNRGSSLLRAEALLAVGMLSFLGSKIENQRHLRPKIVAFNSQLACGFREENTAYQYRSGHNT